MGKALWTEGEVAILRHYYAEGKSFRWIGSIMGLSYGAVASKAIALGLHLPKPLGNVRDATNRMPVEAVVTCLEGVDRVREKQGDAA